MWPGLILFKSAFFAPVVCNASRRSPQSKPGAPNGSVRSPTGRVGVLSAGRWELGAPSARIGDRQLAGGPFLARLRAPRPEGQDRCRGLEPSSCLWRMRADSAPLRLRAQPRLGHTREAEGSRAQERTAALSVSSVSHVYRSAMFQQKIKMFHHTELGCQLPSPLTCKVAGDAKCAASSVSCAREVDPPRRQPAQQLCR